METHFITEITELGLVTTIRGIMCGTILTSMIVGPLKTVTRILMSLCVVPLMSMRFQVNIS
jgi:hypothetical protein